MNKKTIETFIKKYNLNGLVDEVRWIVKDNTLRVTAMTSDKKFLTSITQKKFEGLADVEIGIMDSQKLKQMLNAVSDNVNLTLVSDEKDSQSRVLSVVIDDGKNEVSYMCGHLDVIPAEPKIKQLPSYEVEISLTDEFVERFLKAVASLNEVNLFTLIMNKKKQKLEMVLGYERNLSNRISLELSTVPGKETISNPISFSAKNLKDVLIANSDVKNTTLKVSSAGLAFVEFESDEFQSQYYMINVDVED